MSHQSRWRIRSVSRADWPRLEGLLSGEDLPVQGVQAGASGQFLVASDAAGTIAGLVGLEIHGGHGLLRSLVVAAPARGCGLGGTLVRAVEALAREREIDRLFLLTTTAAGYFERRGYVRVERHALPGPIRRSEEFTQLCPASAVAMASPVIAAGTVPSRP